MQIVAKYFAPRSMDFLSWMFTCAFSSSTVGNAAHAVLKKNKIRIKKYFIPSIAPAALSLFQIVYKTALREKIQNILAQKIARALFSILKLVRFQYNPIQQKK